MYPKNVPRVLCLELYPPRYARVHLVYTRLPRAPSAPATICHCTSERLKTKLAQFFTGTRCHDANSATRWVVGRMDFLERVKLQLREITIRKNWKFQRLLRTTLFFLRPPFSFLRSAMKERTPPNSTRSFVLNCPSYSSFFFAASTGSV